MHVFQIYGYQAVEKTVRAHSDSSARIFLPRSWEGRRVMVVLLEPLEEDT